ncbi:hypothetical protein F383_07207 [Gossypium arboreum]|uniref:Uncharacterized protein n=1 Tax=Gossypium arboreum TaxID=29729 RepID=A0A0B0NI19_GOSAR|nr:hypothetical protein F383_07207 [Gossypium arboreum]
MVSFDFGSWANSRFLSCVYLQVCRIR